MRNLVEYPITTEDVIRSIDSSYLYQAGRGYIGDPNCYCLQLLKEFVETSQEFNSFLKSKEMKNE